MVDYRGRQVVILGLGITGLSCVNFFLAQGINPRIMDIHKSPYGLNKLPKQVECYLGGINSDWLLKSNLVITSPGIPLSHPLLKKVANAGIEIIGDIELFSREAQAPIVAITGSNGKSTVTKLISEMAQSAGWSVGVGGNIGFPVLNLLKYSVQLYVLELSSFQLETTYSLKAMVATVLNVTEDHMDRYPLGIQQYRAAKLRIYKNANVCIVNADDIRTIPIYNTGKRYISFGKHIGDYHFHQCDGNTWLLVRGKKIFNIDDISIFNKHDYINVLSALAIADAISIPRDCILKALTTFSSLPHRFQLIHEANGIRWINDSKATNVASTEAALKNLNELQGTLWLLLGGDSKKADFSRLKLYLSKKDNVKLFCFGRDGDTLAALRPEIATRTETLQQAMELIVVRVKRGDVVLLSPACSSCDQFQNFEHRGNIFSQLAKKNK
ncbi:UDP-N-acetylmuramoyl-L-alanine--D-glutamate ligase [Pantoea sp. Aalb]|uniref:UDP-N-acetylmuramoyl-L-alanine--D-glutamate ligase n=1 Tax=Pantoea sp. Aalb TaxID=2576762 RepID=UPI00132A1925|nr:UDP-N-acetylmuramoyl-L-alanine--D-glutamate ligase [Pantoea sp. Aalb]MXP67184.1 UDP-N-acetylmuramoyl-L-alanine--D-glutamate ligase [Pantoea sp. Aalb]